MTTVDAPRVPAPRRWILGALAVVVAGLVASVIAIDLHTGIAIFVLTVGLGVLVTAWARPVVLVAAGLALLYGNVPVVAEARLGVPYAIAAMAVPGLLAGALLHDIVLRGRRVVVFPTPAMWVLLYYAALVVSTVWSANPPVSQGELLVFLSEGLLLYLLIVNTVRDRGTLHAVLASIVVVAALLGALSLFQTVTGTYGTDYLGFAQHAEQDLAAVLDDPSAEPPRVAGPIGEQNRYAQILLMVLPIPVVAAMRHPRTRVRLASAVLALGCATGVALTTSRGAGVALVLTVLTMVLLRELRARSLLVMAGVVAVLLVLVPQYGTRFARASAIVGGSDGVEQVDGAVVGRLSSNIGAIRVWLDHPVTGVGPGNYGQFHKAAVEDLGLRVIPNREPHNLYPHIAAESGLVGMAAFTGLVVATMLGLLRTRRRLRARGDPAIAATGLLFSVVAYLYSGLFLHLSYARYFWMLLALAAVAPLVDPEPAPAVAGDDLDPDTPTPPR